MTARKKFHRVAVPFGGLSAEREVALNSGMTVIRALREAGYEVEVFDVVDKADLVEWVGQLDADVVFPMLHGRGGEDGQLQGLLEWHGLPYVGSGVLGSALAMDKLRSKWVFASAGIATPPFAVIRSDAERQAMQAQLDYPVMVKPVHEGSSIGMSRVDTADQLAAACIEAFRFDAEVMIEQFIAGSEYTVGIVGDLALPAIRLEAANTFYDYQAKYQSDDTRYFLPCGLSAEGEAQLQSLALQAFRALGCQGWGRVDLMMDAAGQAMVLEVNTIPGMTDHSLLPKASRAQGWELPQLMHEILATVGTPK